MELLGEGKNKQLVLLAEQSSETVAQFAELFGRNGFELVCAGSALEARSLCAQHSFCACIIIDDLKDVGGLEFVRELHRQMEEIPIVLIADVNNRRIPLEEVSVGWSGCYILKDRDASYIKSAYSWIISYLQNKQIEQGSPASRRESSENRELLHSQRLESVGMLASGIAHDFNNILMAILGNASIVKDKIGKDHEAYRFINIIEQCGERASGLSNSLMRYARGEQSDWIPIFLPDHVEELLNIISTGLPGHVIIEKDFDKVTPVEGDSTKLQQVIMNLCLNAGDAMNERKLRSGGQSYIGTLSIRILAAQLSREQILEHGVSMEFQDRGFVRMDISDNGVGMSRTTLQSIFRPFFTTKKSGRGLGLSSVRGIIEEQGGFIEVISEQDVGSTFSVYLPCCEFQIDDDQGIPEVFSDSTVLVIETDEETRRLIGLNLQHMEYQVLLVESLDEALAVFLEHHRQISVVLIRIDEAGLGALQALESLRRVDEQTPIIVMSEAEREQARYLLEDGLASEFMQQPFKPDVLVRIIRDTIRKHEMS